MANKNENKIIASLKSLDKFVNNWQEEFRIRQQDSFEWFMGLTKKIKGDVKNVRDITMLKDSKFSFYTFLYDSKGYEEGSLPWYDYSPLDFIINVKGNYFWAINFHYIHPIIRAKILQALIVSYTDQWFDDKPLINVTWDKFQQLVGSNKKHIKFAIKCYRKDRLISNKGIKVTRIKNEDMDETLGLIGPTWMGTDEFKARKMINAINYNLMSPSKANETYNK